MEAPVEELSQQLQNVLPMNRIYSNEILVERDVNGPNEIEYIYQNGISM